jgi:putative copper resistance protein D
MAVDAVAITIRGLSFVAIFQATGMAMFIWAFASELGETNRRWLRTSTAAYGLAALVLAGAHFALEPARMAGAFSAMGDPALQAIARASPQAEALVWKAAGLALVVGGTVVATRVGLAAALLGAAIVFLGFTRMGHTALHPAGPILGALLWIHLTVAAFWFGALLPLIRIARTESAAVSSALVERFSRAAAWIVPGLAAAGVAMAGVLVGSARGLVTSYGLILLTKLAMFALLMALAALNRWRYGPALAEGDPRYLGKFARTVRIEYILIAAVLMATALLTAVFSPDS